MNQNRNMTIYFNGKHEKKVIKPSKGMSIASRATKPKKKGLARHKVQDGRIV